MELLPDGKMVLDEQDTVGVLALIYAKTRLSTFTPQRTRLYQTTLCDCASDKAAALLFGRDFWRFAATRDRTVRVALRKRQRLPQPPARGPSCSDGLR